MRAADMDLNWQRQCAAWAAHATTAGYRRRVERAREIVRNAMRGFGTGGARRIVCSLSGGKDSVAMAGIIADAGHAADVPCVYAHTDLNLPDTLRTVQATAEQLDMDLDVIEPDGLEEHVRRIADRYGVPMPQPPCSGYDAFSLLEALPATVDVTDAMEDIHRAIAAGNMMVAHLYAHDLRGSFVGLRAEESRGRRWNRALRGPIYRNVLDETWTVTPLVDWTGLDVLAYIEARGLPLHPYYRRAWEWEQGRTPMDRLRVDLAIPGGWIASQGALARLRGAEPEFFARLARCRPELLRYV